MKHLGQFLAQSRKQFLQRPTVLQQQKMQWERRLSDFTFSFHFHALEKEMATPSSVLTWSGIKIAGRNINKLRYSDDTTLMAESEEELKSLLMKVKEESEIGRAHV